MTKCEHCISRTLNSMKSLTKEELKGVSDCKTTIFYKKGDIIFNEGETLHGIFCLKKGICKLSKLTANGKNQTVKLLSKGEFLGEQSIISKERSNLTAVALNEIELCFLPKEEILSCLHENNEFSFNTLKHMVYQLKKSENDLINMAQKSVKQRLAEALIYVQKTFGTEADETLSLVLSREDYANIVGTARELVIRIFSQFNKKGIITIIGKQIRIEDLEALKRVE